MNVFLIGSDSYFQELLFDSEIPSLMASALKHADDLWTGNTPFL